VQARSQHYKLANMAPTVFALEAIADLVGDMAEKGCDIRLEAAAAKEWNTVRAWKIVDDGLEIRGGRGYEDERSLAALWAGGARRRKGEPRATSSSGCPFLSWRLLAARRAPRCDLIARSRWARARRRRRRWATTRACVVAQMLDVAIRQYRALAFP
jgi:hypothetical protein